MYVGRIEVSSTNLILTCESVKVEYFTIAEVTDLINENVRKYSDGAG